MPLSCAGLSSTTGARVRIDPSRYRIRLLLLLWLLLLAGAGLLLFRGYGLLSLCLAAVLLTSLHRQWPQPGLGCELLAHRGTWVWRTPDGQWPVRIRRSNLSLPLVTLVELEAPATGCRWQLALFHDSVPVSALRELRRLIRVQR